MKDTIKTLYPAQQQDPPLQLGPPDAAGGGDGAGLQPPAEIPPGTYVRTHAVPAKVPFVCSNKILI